MAVAATILVALSAVACSSKSSDDSNPAAAPTSTSISTFTSTSAFTPTSTTGAPTSANNAALTVVSRDNRFETTELRAPAGDAFTIVFDNQDAGIPHNLAVYRSGPPAADMVAATAVDQGPTRQELRLGPLAPGRYFYQCDVHATLMTGTLTIE